MGVIIIIVKSLFFPKEKLPPLLPHSLWGKLPVEICHDLGCPWLSLEWHCKVNVGVRCQVSVVSRKIVYLDCEAKLWFRSWERNYPLSLNFTQRRCVIWGTETMSTFSTVLACNRCAVDICYLNGWIKRERKVKNLELEWLFLQFCKCHFLQPVLGDRRDSKVS